MQLLNSKARSPTRPQCWQLLAKKVIGLFAAMTAKFTLLQATTSLIGSWTALSYPASDVLSVNGLTGSVVLDADDVSDAATTNKYTTTADISKLSGIEAGHKLMSQPT